MRPQRKHLFLFGALLLLIAISTTGVVAVILKNKAQASDASVTVAKSKIEEGETASVSAVPAQTEVVLRTIDTASASAPVDVSVAAPDVAAPPAATATNTYPLHTNITTTYFWAGEEADADNKNISNLPSAWDEAWVLHFGGIDNPNKRSAYFPSGFTPKENPFYFALPYNDFDENGNRKKEVYNLVPWAKAHDWKASESLLKNRWIKIIKGNKVAYAQWQDVGPFKEDDGAYVFGSAQPKSKTNQHAGLDVSPAVHDLLGLEDIDHVDWQFVDVGAVPDGPWKKVVTTSQIYWK